MQSTTAPVVGMEENTALLERTLSEMEANEPDDALEPMFIDAQVEQQMAAWFIAYSTS